MITRSANRNGLRIVKKGGDCMDPEARDRLEIDRLGNLITGFGWKVTKQEFTDEKIVIQIEKVRGPGVEVPEAGPA